jgi:DNA-binding GntR family transcriptional regulator
MAWMEAPMSVADSGTWSAELPQQHRSRLADEVADVLRKRIISGEIGSGTQLLQLQLAERLGVSRTPLREAFRILERDGLVKISNGNKTIEVAHLGVEDQLATYQVRAVTDGLAARLAALRGLTAASEEKFAECMATMEEATAGTLSPARYTEAHASWHLLLLEVCGNTRLLECARLVRVSSHMLITRQLSDPERAAVRSVITTLVRNGNSDHRQILEAIREQNPAAAERSAVRHIDRSVKFARDVLARRAPTEAVSTGT